MSNSYHTNLKLAAQTGLLPEEIKKQIPKSTLHRFVHTDYSSCFGMEYATVIEDNLKLIKQFLADQKALTVYRTYVLLKSLFIKWFVKIPQKITFKCKEKIIYAIDRFKSIIGFEKIIKLFQITRHTYYTWKNQVDYPCTESLIHRCLRTHPNQLTQSEVLKMKNIYTSDKFKGWSIYSIALYCQINNILSVCVGSWYKYLKLLKISYHCIRRQYAKKKTGIRAKAPHETWHADVTVFRTMDNLKAYIYFVVDNFSRYILSWRVSLKLSGQIMLENLREAYETYIMPTGPPGQDVQLLVDDGPENYNSVVDAFVKSKTISLKRLLAGTDILYSNSMVEAVNRVVKYQFLFHRDIASFNTLDRYLQECIPDFNTKRPHYGLHGNTPEQVLNGNYLDWERLSSQMKAARVRRMEENRKSSCEICEE